MIDPVDQDNMRHQSETDAAQKRTEWIVEQTELLANKWRIELKQNGEVAVIDWDEADMLQAGIDAEVSYNVMIERKARKWVIDNENKLLQETIGWN